MFTIIMTRTKPNYSRGDVVLVLFPHSDLVTAKPRPALVVQGDDLQTGLPQVVVAMITSRMFRANHQSRVVISLSEPHGKRSGLLTDSVVMTDNLATIAESKSNAKSALSRWSRSMLPCVTPWHCDLDFSKPIHNIHSIVPNVTGG